MTTAFLQKLVQLCNRNLIAYFILPTRVNTLQLAQHSPTELRHLALVKGSGREPFAIELEPKRKYRCGFVEITNAKREAAEALKTASLQRESALKSKNGCLERETAGSRN